MTQQRDDAKPIKVLAAFADYEGLVRAIRERRSALGLSQLALDDLAGLPSGYTAKIEAMLTNPRRQECARHRPGKPASAAGCARHRVSGCAGRCPASATSRRTARR